MIHIWAHGYDQGEVSLSLSHQVQYWPDYIFKYQRLYDLVMPTKYLHWTNVLILRPHLVYSLIPLFIWCVGTMRSYIYTCPIHWIEIVLDWNYIFLFGAIWVSITTFSHCLISIGYGCLTVFVFPIPFGSIYYTRTLHT